MLWTRETIKAILLDPKGKTEVSGKVLTNNSLIYRMLQSLYARQTAYEQASKSTVEDNGIGFNGFDSGFLSDVAERSKAYGRLSSLQAAKVAKRLIKYAGQLESIAQENIQATLPLCGYCGVVGHVQSACPEYTKIEFGK